MDYQDILTLVREIVYTKTGQNLDLLQEAIIKGSLQGKTYQQIAEDSLYSDGYVKDIGSNLWKLLSEVLGEDVKKYNLRFRLERWELQLQLHNHNISSPLVVKKNSIEINNLNVCSAILNANSPPESPPDNQENSEAKIDLDNAFFCDICYGRDQEIQDLKRLILPNRLLVITGIKGIGKTSIIGNLVSSIKADFNYILWLNLKDFLTIETLQNELVKFFYSQGKTETKIQKNNHIWLDYLRNYRCLIVLDDWESIYSSGQLSGIYRSEWEDYRSLLSKIATMNHNSCVIVNTAEIPREMTTFTFKNDSVCLFQLRGLGNEAFQLLQDFGLKDEQNYCQLIEEYSGNPLWLKIVASTIKELFSGKIDLFLKYDILPEDLKVILEQNYQVLSESEKEVLEVLSREEQPLSLEQCLEKQQLASLLVITALQSLCRRFLIEKNEAGEETLFSVIPVFKKFFLYY